MASADLWLVLTLLSNLKSYIFDTKTCSCIQKALFTFSNSSVIVGLVEYEVVTKTWWYSFLTCDVECAVIVIVVMYFSELFICALQEKL